jgi:hypothetical protein
LKYEILYDIEDKPNPMVKFQNGPEEIPLGELTVNSIPSIEIERTSNNPILKYRVPLFHQSFRNCFVAF